MLRYSIPACSFPRDNASCLFNYQAERLKEQASCWEKEEREGYTVTHGHRQPLTKVHCKIPFRTYQRRPTPTWTRRIQQPEAVSDDETDEDSDASPPVLKKAHAILAAKRKVPFGVCVTDAGHHWSAVVVCDKVELHDIWILSFIKEHSGYLSEMERFDKYS